MPLNTFKTNIWHGKKLEGARRKRKDDKDVYHFQFIIKRLRLLLISVILVGAQGWRQWVLQIYLRNLLFGFIFDHCWPIGEGIQDKLCWWFRWCRERNIGHIDRKICKKFLSNAHLFVYTLRMWTPQRYEEAWRVHGGRGCCWNIKKIVFWWGYSQTNARRHGRLTRSKCSFSETPNYEISSDFLEWTH